MKSEKKSVDRTQNFNFASLKYFIGEKIEMVYFNIL